MAKKKSAFKMAEEIRSVLTKSPKLSASETLEAVQTKHPGTKVNEKSFGVAFYGARKKLGIGGRRGKKVVRRKRPSAAQPIINLGTLQAAAKFIAEAGSAETAIDAIRQVQALQVK
jgi:hypothetical protein